MKEAGANTLPIDYPANVEGSYDGSVIGAYHQTIHVAYHIVDHVVGWPRNNGLACTI